MAAQNKKLYSLDEIISMSLPLPLFFENDSGRQLVVYPYCYFSKDEDFNQYAFDRGVIIFKYRGDSYITAYNKRVVEVFQTLGFWKAQYFKGFDPHEMLPRDKNLREAWQEYVKKMEKTS